MHIQPPGTRQRAGKQPFPAPKKSREICNRLTITSRIESTPQASQFHASSSPSRDRRMGTILFYCRNGYHGPRYPDYEVICGIIYGFRCYGDRNLEAIEKLITSLIDLAIPKISIFLLEYRCRSNIIELVAKGSGLVWKLNFFICPDITLLSQTVSPLMVRYSRPRLCKNSLLLPSKIPTIHFRSTFLQHIKTISVADG